MKSSHKHPTYIEWLSAEQMHEASKQWLSELNFIKDEHRFFEDLITMFTSQLIVDNKYADTTEVIDSIYVSKKQNRKLIDTIRKHENALEIMVDGVNQLEEEKAYKSHHKELISIIDKFLNNYKSLKLQLFEFIKSIKKEEKQTRLIDRK